MLLEDFVTQASESQGVLPVDVSLQNSGDIENTTPSPSSDEFIGAQSALRQLLFEGGVKVRTLDDVMNFPTSGVKHNAEKVNATGQKIADDGGAVLLSGDSSGDLGFSSTTFFTFDAWGSDLPSYGMDMVFVTAEKDLMEFRNYFSTPLTLPEYTAIEGGGGGGGG